jgi:predicted glycosyltransferase
VASVSQCGYYTALDLLAAGVPALVVPYAKGDEDEQSRRARRLEALGAVRVLPSEELHGATLAQAIRGLLTFQPTPLAVDLNGAAHSASYLRERVGA